MMLIILYILSFIYGGGWEGQITDTYQNFMIVSKSGDSWEHIFISDFLCNISLNNGCLVWSNMLLTYSDQASHSRVVTTLLGNEARDHDPVLPTYVVLFKMISVMFDHMHCKIKVCMPC